MQAAFSLGTAGAVAVGGAIGSVLRYLVGLLVPHSPAGAAMPWATVAVNVSGSLLLGALAGAAVAGTGPAPLPRAFLTIGVLGGFTTFSTFSVDAVSLLHAGSPARAALYIAVSVLGSIGAAYLGFTWMRG